jgi:hypothetical protein
MRLASLKNLDNFEHPIILPRIVSKNLENTVGNVFEGFMNYICIFKAFGVIVLHSGINSSGRAFSLFKQKIKKFEFQIYPEESCRHNRLHGQNLF